MTTDDYERRLSEATDNRDEFDRWWKTKNSLDANAAIPPVEGQVGENNPHIHEDQKYTDIGNANTFIDLHVDAVRYVPIWRKWIVWYQKRWVVDYNDVLVTKLAKDVADVIFEQVRAAPTTKLATPIVTAARRASSATGIRSFLVIARGADGVRIEPADLDVDPWLFGVANGYIDLRTGTFHEPDSSKLITKSSPVIYDPEATAPRFMAALQQWHPDPEVREYLQRLTGHAIAGESRGDHILVIHYGDGRNGKGTFVNIMEAIFGPYFVVPDKSLLMQLRREEHATVKATLFRARLAVASETAQRHKLNEADVKNLTGGDRINARRMYEDEWSFPPTHSLWMQTNHLPEIKGTDDGIWSRIKVVPWLQKFEGKDKNPDLDKQLREELPGILNYVIEGCRRWQDEGLDTVASMVRDATDRYHESEDVLARFVADEGYEFCHTSEGEVQDATLKTLLASWCENESILVINARDVNSWLESKGCVRKRKSGGTTKVQFWLGIRRAN